MDDHTPLPLLVLDTRKEGAAMWDAPTPLHEFVYHERGVRRCAYRIVCFGGRICFATTDDGNREIAAPTVEAGGEGMRYSISRKDLEEARVFKPDSIAIETANGTINYYLRR